MDRWLEGGNRTKCAELFTETVGPTFTSSRRSAGLQIFHMQLYCDDLINIHSYSYGMWKIFTPDPPYVTECDPDRAAESDECLTSRRSHSGSVTKAHEQEKMMLRDNYH